MNKYKRMPIYLIVVALIFYVLPLFKSKLGGDFVVLWIITPLVCFLLGYVFGLFHNMSFLFVIALAVLFIPAVIFYYRQIAMLYALVYGLVAMTGNVLGARHYKARHSDKDADKRAGKDKDERRDEEPAEEVTEENAEVEEDNAEEAPRGEEDA